MSFETIHANYLAPVISGVIVSLITAYIIAKNKSNSSKEDRKRIWSYIKKYKYYIFTVLGVLLVFFVITFYRIALKTGSELTTDNTTKGIIEIDTVSDIYKVSQGSSKLPTTGHREGAIQVLDQDKKGETGPQVELNVPIEREIIIEGIGFDYNKYKAIDNAKDSARQKLLESGFSDEEVKYREVIETKVDTLPNGIQAIVKVKITAK